MTTRMPVTRLMATKAREAYIAFRDAHAGRLPMEFRMNPETLEAIEIENIAFGNDRFYPDPFAPKSATVLSFIGVRTVPDASIPAGEVAAQYSA